MAPLTTDEWVRQLNTLCWEMDEITHTTHPTSWAEQGMADLMNRWRELAVADTADQLELPGLGLFDGPPIDGEEVCL